jgi:hypothetical protein
MAEVATDVRTGILRCGLRLRSGHIGYLVEEHALGVAQ